MTTPFSELVAATDPAMVVVTAEADGIRDGCLVGFHSQCSIEPERYAVWLSVANRTYRLALFAGHLAVHLLGPSDAAPAALFGGTTGDDTDKFAACAWHPGPHGTVLVDALPNRFVGRRVAVLDTGGDHVCFVLEPIEAERFAPGAVLRLGDVSGVAPGHEAEERPISGMP